MRRTAVRRLYGGMDGRQRYRLFLATAARLDLAEADHLRASARHDADGGWAFHEAHEECRALTWIYLVCAQASLTVLQMTKVLEPALRAVAYSQDPKAGDAFVEWVEELLAAARRGALRGLKTLTQAYGDVGAECLGLPADLLPSFQFPTLYETFRDYAEELQATEVSEEGIERMRAIFRAYTEPMGPMSSLLRTGAEKG